MAYFAEFTDTYAGEANYCWVKLAYIESANDLKTAMKKARAQFGLTGIRGDIVAKYGDETHWKPRGSCTILMVRWNDCPAESRYDAPVI